MPNCGQKFSQLHESETHYNAVHRCAESKCHLKWNPFLDTAALSAKRLYLPPIFWSCTFRRITIPSSRCSLKGLLPINASSPLVLKPFGDPKNVMLMPSKITNSPPTFGLTQLSAGKRREGGEGTLGNYAYSNEHSPYSGISIGKGIEELWENVFSL